MNKRNTKTALVLAGGGLTGAVYEIGALRAIDDVLVDRTVNDFDIYIGTSSGALVSAFMSNGASPETLFKIIDGSHPLAGALDRRLIFNINWKEYARWLVGFPGELLKEWLHYFQHYGDTSIIDMLWSLSDSIPPGLYDGSALQKLVEKGLTGLGYSNDFYDLEKELYLIATDLATGERAIFGRDYIPTTVSQAVSASSAAPFLYKPIHINGHDYIDGGLRGSASIDLAIERGAELVVVINPMVSFDQLTTQENASERDHHTHIVDKGIQSVANQVIRIALHSGLQYHIKQVRRSNPNVDILLIEPSPEDYHMFSQNIMRYSARTDVARHGFETVTVRLAEDFTRYQEILQRHGIPISRRLVKAELDEIVESNYDPGAVRHVLEARSSVSGQMRRERPLYKLEQTLAELDLVLDQLAGDR